MFPDADMHGIDLVLPDFTYLRENADRIVGCVATHGHEDHVGALQFLLRELRFPIYGSPLTLGLARNRIEEAGLLGRTELDHGGRRRAAHDRPVRRRVHPGHPLGAARLRHRRAHARRASILHSGDFKLDLTPVDGRRTDLARIGAIASTEGIRLLLADSTNAEEHGLRAERAQRRRRAARRCSPSTPAGGSSPPASPATSTASSRSPTPRSPAAGSSPRSGCR